MQAFNVSDRSGIAGKYSVSPLKHVVCWCITLQIADPLRFSVTVSEPVSVLTFLRAALT